MMEGSNLLEKISIIIPVFNSEQYLERCLDSVINQIYSNLEIILVDDASTDSSGKICDKYACIDTRIRVIHHDENKGLSLSKYDGYKVSTGKWISFIDNDDLITDSMYDIMSDLLKQYSEAEMICLAGKDETSQNIDEAIHQLNSVRRKSGKYDEKCNIKCVSGENACQLLYGYNSSGSLSRGIYTATWGKIIRKDLFEKALNETIQYKEKLYWIFLEDVLFIPICMHMAEKTVISDQLSYLHRMSESNLSAKLKPSEYHYETIMANDIVQAYYRANSMEEVADAMLKGLLLNMQSVWYKVYRYEDDSSKRNDGLDVIKKLWIKYYKLYKKLQKRDIDLLSSVSIGLFNFSNKVWLYTIGDLHFKRGI